MSSKNRSIGSRSNNISQMRITQNQSLISQVYKGPLPPAVEMERYEKIKAGTMDRIIEFIVNEHDSEFLIINKQIDTNKELKLATLNSFTHFFHVTVIVVMLFFAVAIIVTILGYELLGLAISVPSIALSIKLVFTIKQK